MDTNSWKSDSGSSGIPPIRIRTLNDIPIRPSGEFVLYWMTAARRLGWNFGLQHAADLARKYRRPLVLLETIQVDEPWASERFHRFVMDGMAEHRSELDRSPILYHPFVEREPGETRDLVEALASRSCIVVSDEFPYRPALAVQEGVAGRLGVRMELVDGNGLLPLRAAGRAYPSAYHFRRFLQGQIADHLLCPPMEDPGLERMPAAGDELIREESIRWPSPDLDGSACGQLLSGLPIDHTVGAVSRPGGSAAAEATLEKFIDEGLALYGSERTHPDSDASSGLSPYLHSGHLSAHRVFDAVASDEGWTPLDLAGEATGRKSRWWGVSESAEAFLDELVTWREVGFNMSAHRDDYDRYPSLPAWARQTLEDHETDERPALYTLEELEEARTYDRIWNAVQRELTREGRIHGYLRMLWGKKILEWTPTARDALAVMVELNNKYAIDGRDPNSYSGIFWTLGRYDRPWPSRPVFGRVRSMSSGATRRKVLMEGYLERFAGS